MMKKKSNAPRATGMKAGRALAASTSRLKSI